MELRWVEEDGGSVHASLAKGGKEYYFHIQFARYTLFAEIHNFPYVYGNKALKMKDFSMGGLGSMISHHWYNLRQKLAMRKAKKWVEEELENL